METKLRKWEETLATAIGEVERTAMTLHLIQKALGEMQTEVVKTLVEIKEVEEDGVGD